MKPAPFHYVRADSSDEVVELLHQHGEEARILAGGQSLMPALNMRFARPAVLIDISRCADLSFTRFEKNQLTVGATTTQSALELVLRGHDALALLSQALPHLGHFQTRNRGTVCGSIAHADPSAELPLCLATLGGRVNLRSKQRRRALSAREFFQGVLTTAREPNELVESVEFPLARDSKSQGFAEFSLRHGDFAIVALAAVASENSVTLGIGGVADRPWVETIPTDSDFTADRLVELAQKLPAQDDLHASAQYRRHLVRTLGSKLMTKVLQ